jgi:NADH:ubiquinone oxidoreductase subunit 6 (subunit J)
VNPVDPFSSASEALFLVTAVCAVIGAICTIAAKRPLRAAMGLLFHIIALAGMYLTLHAQLLAAVQLLVYAGAIVVLFVFVIMLFGPEAEGSQRPGRGLIIRVVTGVMMALITVTVAFTTLGTSIEVPPVGREQALEEQLRFMGDLSKIEAEVVFAEAQTAELSALISEHTSQADFAGFQIIAFAGALDNGDGQRLAQRYASGVASEMFSLGLPADQIDSRGQAAPAEAGLRPGEVLIRFVRRDVALGSVAAMGLALYRDAVIPFELVSITLLVAIIGAIAVAKGRSKSEIRAAKARRLAQEAEAKAKQQREKAMAAEVAAHGGH